MSEFRYLSTAYYLSIYRVSWLQEDSNKIACSVVLKPPYKAVQV